MFADEHRPQPGNRIRLARELRRLRERAGLSGRQLAEAIGISQSKVSRIESGQTVPNGAEVSAWAAAVNASVTTTDLLSVLTDAIYNGIRPWHAALRERIHIQGEIQEIESRANVKLAYQPTVVPGLLQTAEYARRVFTMFDPTYAEADIPAVVAGRLDRQLALFDPAMRFSFLITEGALRWRAGPATVMAAQMDRIASLSTLENVTIGLIPHAEPATTHVPHGFVVFESADGDTDPLVMVETVHANITVTEPAHIALYRRQWGLLEKMAVFGDDARGFLAEIIADFRGSRPAGERS
ncbi:MAG TPA: helix-turn-helix transcriptional regulator [Trebonia sp.]|nr:helix-turn-helix transcriptional regulator [Trebonia sp.]